MLFFHFKVIINSLLLYILRKVTRQYFFQTEIYSEKKTLKNENINHLMPKDSEKPEGMSKRDFDFFKNQFS